MLQILNIPNKFYETSNCNQLLLLVDILALTNELDDESFHEQSTILPNRIV